MADQDINIRVNTAQTGPGLQPTIKDVEKLTEATKDLTAEQQRLADVQREMEARGPVELKSGLAVKPSGLAEKLDTKHQDFLRAQEIAAARRENADIDKNRQAARDRVTGGIQSGDISGNVAEKVNESTSGLRTALRQGAQVAGLQSVGRALASLAGPLGLVVAGFAGVAGAVKLAWDSLKAFVNVQSEVRSLNQTLAVTGNFSQALSASLQELAQAREKNTGISDEKWIGSFKELLKAGASANSLPELSTDVENLTTVTGDLGSATKLMADALRGEWSGFKELGIHIDEAASQAQKFEQLSGRLTAAAGILAEGQKDVSAQMAHTVAEFKRMEAGIGSYLAAIAVNNLAVRTFTGGIKLMQDWFGKTVTATANLVSSAQGIKPVFFDAARALKAVTDELRDQKELLDYIDKATEKKIARDKVATKSKIDQMEAERAYKESLIRSKEVDGQLGRPGGIDSFTAAKQVAQLNDQYAIRKARLEKQQREKEIADKENVVVAAKDTMNSAAVMSQGAEEALKEGYEKQKQKDSAIGRMNQLKQRLDKVNAKSDWIPTKEADAKELETQILDERRNVQKLSKGKSLDQLKTEAEAAKKAVDEASAAYLKLQSVQEDISKLKREDESADMRAAATLAQQRVDAAINKREKFSQVVNDFKDGKTKVIPQASAQDFNVDPNFRHAEVIAQSQISGVAVNPKSVAQVSENARRQDVAAGTIEKVLGDALSKGIDPSNSKAASAASAKLQAVLEKSFNDQLDSTRRLTELVTAQQRQIDQMNSQIKRIRPQM